MNQLSLVDYGFTIINIKCHDLH